MSNSVRQAAALIPEIHLIRDAALREATARLWSGAERPTEGALLRVRGTMRVCAAAAEALQEVFAGAGSADRDVLLAAALASGAGAEAARGVELPEAVAAAAFDEVREGESLEAMILWYARELVGEVAGVNGGPG